MTSLPLVLCSSRRSSKLSTETSIPGSGRDRGDDGAVVGIALVGEGDGRGEQQRGRRERCRRGSARTSFVNWTGSGSGGGVRQRGRRAAELARAARGARRGKRASRHPPMSWLNGPRGGDSANARPSVTASGREAAALQRSEQPRWALEDRGRGRAAGPQAAAATSGGRAGAMASSPMKRPLSRARAAAGTGAVEARSLAGQARPPTNRPGRRARGGDRQPSARHDRRDVSAVGRAQRRAA